MKEIEAQGQLEDNRLFGACKQLMSCLQRLADAYPAAALAQSVAGVEFLPFDEDEIPRGNDQLSAARKQLLAREKAHPLSTASQPWICVLMSPRLQEPESKLCRAPAAEEQWPGMGLQPRTLQTRQLVCAVCSECRVASRLWHG